MWVSGTPSQKEVFQFKVCTLLFPPTGEWNADSLLADTQAAQNALELPAQLSHLVFPNFHSLVKSSTIPIKYALRVINAAHV